MSTLSEAYTDHPLHLHQIIPLDFDSVRAVPESHVWPNSDDDFPPADVDDHGQFTTPVPVIDLSDPDAATKLIGHACETWGVFQVINHGIPSSLVQEAESEVRRLFSLPARQKLKALRAPGGATGYGIARITPFFSKYMWHEGFTIMNNSAIDHANTLWPNDEHARFCDVIEDYQKKMSILAEQLTKLIFKSLDISEEEEEMDQWWVDPSTALQLNSYPSCPDPSRALGLAPHTDTSLITILHQSSTIINGGGLQVFNDGVGWVPVVPVSGALVVNVGDLLHILSNGRFISVLHRVFVNQNLQRLSMAYFYSPPTGFRVAPLTKLVNSSGQVPRYRSVTVREFISIKAKSLDKALSFIEN
ncbi:hypothetical protein EZV62_013455 [Acer yangbiense]|uniref:gibberellin 3beta-dioxygenase n=1 Tax=Acer yangbiense TaxID=1000413 RepID=A0A5C7I111_9ROSI|nr:hypothetical protein EZV62_013455 [Acer yangbiense]